MGSNGKIIAAICNHQEVRVWNLIDNEWKSEILIQNSEHAFAIISKIKISEDCRRLIAVGDGEIIV